MTQDKFVEQPFARGHAIDGRDQSRSVDRSREQGVDAVDDRRHDPLEIGRAHV